MNISIVYTTCSSYEEAKKIGRVLVDKKLAACANIFPDMESIFEYDGELCQKKEFVLIIKTISDFFYKIEKEIYALHSYEVPCIMEFKCTNVSSRFKSWIKNLIIS